MEGVKGLRSPWFEERGKNTRIGKKNILKWMLDRQLVMKVGIGNFPGRRLSNFDQTKSLAWPAT